MIYLDANVIIRLIDGQPAIKSTIVARLSSESEFATSQLSRLECRCLPLRMANQILLDLYDEFFRSKELTLVDIDAQVIDRATEIRATSRFKTPDAIHLASAIVVGASAFLTGDQDLTRFAGITVEKI